MNGELERSAAVKAADAAADEEQQRRIEAEASEGGRRMGSVLKEEVSGSWHADGARF